MSQKVFPRGGWLVAVAMVLGWSWTPLLSKTPGWDPLSMIVMRGAVSAPVILVLALICGIRPTITKNSALAGMMMGTASAAFITSMAYGPATTGIVLTYSAPLWSALLESALGRLRLTLALILCACSTLLGVALINLEGLRLFSSLGLTSDLTLHVFFALLCGVTFAVQGVAMAQEGTSDGAFKSTVWGALFVGFAVPGLLLLPFSYRSFAVLLQGRALYVTAAAMNGLCALLPSFAHAWLAVRIGGTRTSIIGALEVALTAIWAWLFLHERLTLSQQIGTVFVIAPAIYIMTHRPKKG